MSEQYNITIRYNGVNYPYIPINEEIEACLLDKNRVFATIGASLEDAVELEIDFQPILQEVTNGSLITHRFNGFGNVIEEPIPRFKNSDSFEGFIDSIGNNPYDTARTLRNYIARLFYHNDMPVLNKGDLIGSCNRSCTVLSPSDTALYINNLIDIGFLVVTTSKITKVFRVDCVVGSSLYLNTDFYDTDRFAMGAPSVTHADDNKDSDS